MQFSINISRVQYASLEKKLEHGTEDTSFKANNNVLNDSGPPLSSIIKLLLSLASHHDSVIDVEIST